MIIARQSTARTVMVGPVLDADGVAVTGGVVADFKISKNGAAPAALNGSATLTHRHTGHYSLALTATDLDTVGQAEVVIDDTVNACPAKEITVIEEVIYDAQFAASANAYAGAAGSTTLGAGAINNAALAADTNLKPDRTATAQAGAASTITLDTGASAVDNFYQYTAIRLIGGTGAGQTRLIASYVGSTKVATVDVPWVTNPDSTSVFAIYPANASPNIKKGVAFAKFMFLMTDSTTHDPATGKTVSVTISKDGGAFGALSSGDTVTEVGNGIYEVDLNATDTNANCFVVRATATGCDPTLDRVFTAS